MIGKVFKLEIDCHKYCGKLFQFLCFHQFDTETLGTVSAPLVNISGIVTSLNSSSYASLAVTTNIKLPSISAMLFPSRSWNGSRKSNICYYFMGGESERNQNKRTHSKSVNRSGLRPEWNFRACTPQYTSVFPKQHSHTKVCTHPTESALQWKEKLHWHFLVYTQS